MKLITMDETLWQEMRSLRLEMLADTPTAYVESLETALNLPEEEWRFRARRSAQPNSRTLVAVADDGRWIGTMTGFVRPDGVAMLVGVYVAAAARGTGVSDALLDGIEAWTLEQGHFHLVLGVHEDGLPAQSFYRRRGYRPTGETEPYPLDPTKNEIIMSRTLGAR